MNFIGKSPGVYVPESTPPPSIVPEVTISRLMLIGKLPWTNNASEDQRVWECNSWRDIINKAYSLDKNLGPAAVLELCKNLSWCDKGPKSILSDRFAAVLPKLLGAGGEQKAEAGKAEPEKEHQADKLGAGGEQKAEAGKAEPEKEHQADKLGAGGEQKTEAGEAEPEKEHQADKLGAGGEQKAEAGKAEPEKEHQADKLGAGGEQKTEAGKAELEKKHQADELLAGHVALTFLALRTYFENGGGSVVVFEPEDLDNTPGEAFNQKLLQDFDIGIVCAPGRRKAFYENLLTVCGKRDSDPDGDAFCFVLIDAPRVKNLEQPFTQQYDPAGHSSACFGPWLKQKIEVRDENAKNNNDAMKTLVLDLPPSPAVAGAFAACDAMYGPFRAAAGVQFTVKGNWELAAGLSDSEIGLENDKGHNQLRQFGRGQRPVIWGARTLSQNIDLQYIPVARVLLTFRKAIKHALRSFVFFPNNSELRQWVYRMLYGYLEDRRRRGWLKGESADDAFVIEFPSSVQDEKSGILRVRVRVALAKPAEFIEVEISQLQEYAA